MPHLADVDADPAACTLLRVNINPAVYLFYRVKNAAFLAASLSFTGIAASDRDHRGVILRVQQAVHRIIVVLLRKAPAVF